MTDRIPTAVIKKETKVARAGCVCTSNQYLSFHFVDITYEALRACAQTPTRNTRAGAGSIIEWNIGIPTLHRRSSGHVESSWTGDIADA